MDKTRLTSRTLRAASAAGGPGAGHRSSVLDGPWWLGALALVSVAVLAFGSAPWSWLGLAALAIFFWLPVCLRWGLSIWRSPAAFREGFRS